jgi:hypothetical protein
LGRVRKPDYNLVAERPRRGGRDERAVAFGENPVEHGQAAPADEAIGDRLVLARSRQSRAVAFADQVEMLRPKD